MKRDCPFPIDEGRVAAALGAWRNSQGKGKGSQELGATAKAGAKAKAGLKRKRGGAAKRAARAAAAASK